MRCVDELDIYEDDGETRKTYRTFYAARKITKLELINDRPGKNGLPITNCVWIKQTQPEDQGTDGEIWTPCLCRTIDEEKGEFTLDITKCMPPWTGDNVPEVYEVRASGVFWAPDGRQEARPLDIIKELLQHYCGVPYNEYTFNQTEFTTHGRAACN
jgi:hypothetical protein